jgi:hypothetical protein
MRAALLLALGSLVGCSSIPDVRFEDDAGSASSSGTSTSGGDTDGGDTDGGEGGTSGSSGQDYDCPDKPPPENVGICCENRLCLGCARSHCERCERNCGRNEVCCRTGGSTTNVSCRSSSSCR